MIRNILRKHPLLYSFVRNAHIIQGNICAFPNNVKLGKKYKSILADLPTSNNRIWYFCVPLHNNLGDYAQYVCIKKWISETYPDYDLIEIPSCVIDQDFVGLMNLLKQKVSSNDIIIFQSGYTSTDLHVDENVHREIAGTFIRNRIIFFPQTVKYSSEKEAQKTAQIYNRHRRILFMARDKHSFEIAGKYFTHIKVCLMPDIVTTLIGEPVLEHSRKGIFFCIRHDSEKKYSDERVKEVFAPLMTADDEWGDTTLAKGEKCSFDVIENTIRRFSQHKLIVTDRFHGTIFSLVASTPVVVMPTVDHKVSEGAEWFLQCYPKNIAKATSVEQAFKMARDMINIPGDVINQKYFKEHYYDSLITTINNL